MYKYILDTDTYVFLSMQCFCWNTKTARNTLWKITIQRVRVLYHIVKMDSKYIYWCRPLHTHIVRVWSAAFIYKRITINMTQHKIGIHVSNYTKTPSVPSPYHIDLYIIITILMRGRETCAALSQAFSHPKEPLKTNHIIYGYSYNVGSIKPIQKKKKSSKRLKSYCMYICVAAQSCWARTLNIGTWIAGSKRNFIIEHMQLRNMWMLNILGWTKWKTFNILIAQKIKIWII